MVTNNFGLLFHHFGLAVINKEKALSFIDGLGYKIGQEIYDPLQKVYLTFCFSENMPAIEVISKSEEAGPLDSILKNQNEMIYHICYQTNNISSSITSIKKSGLRIIPVSPAKKAILFNNQVVSFYFISGFGLVEILEKKISDH